MNDDSATLIGQAGEGLPGAVLASSGQITGGPSDGTPFQVGEIFDALKSSTLQHRILLFGSFSENGGKVNPNALRPSKCLV